MPADAVTDMVQDAVRANADASLLNLAAKAHGNPFLVSELVCGLAEEGRLTVSDGCAVARGHTGYLDVWALACSSAWICSPIVLEKWDGSPMNLLEGPETLMVRVSRQPGAVHDSSTTASPPRLPHHRPGQLTSPGIGLSGAKRDHLELERPRLHDERPANECF